MDKQDRLEDAIGTALNQWSTQFHPTTSKVDAIAAAVRSFMGSDEVVGKSAAAMAVEVNLTFSGFDERTQSKYRRQARAALSAAIGEDIGGRNGR